MTARRSLYLLTAITLVIAYVAVPRPAVSPSGHPSTGSAPVDGLRTGAPQTPGASPTADAASPFDPASFPPEGYGIADPSGGLDGAASYARPTPKPHLFSVSGIATTYGPGWDGWIAWPDGPGYILRVCGPGGCETVVSNDAGPSLKGQRMGRVIDLDVPTFESVCGVRWTRGTCNVTVIVKGRTKP